MNYRNVEIYKGLPVTIPFIPVFRIRKSQKQKVDESAGGAADDWYKFSFCGDEGVLNLDDSNGHATPHSQNPL